MRTFFLVCAVVGVVSLVAATYRFAMQEQFEPLAFVWLTASELVAVIAAGGYEACRPRRQKRADAP